MKRDWAVMRMVLASMDPLVVTRWRARVALGRVRYWWSESERVVRWVRRVSECVSQLIGGGCCDGVLAVVFIDSS